MGDVDDLDRDVVTVRYLAGEKMGCYQSEPGVSQRASTLRIEAQYRASRLSCVVAGVSLLCSCRLLLFGSLSPIQKHEQTESDEYGKYSWNKIDDVRRAVIRTAGNHRAHLSLECIPDSDTTANDTENAESLAQTVPLHTVSVTVSQ
ncbi:hypothetical protein [Halomicrococcus sp. NG-SE-24]|uniref:hypothetical protein n=1 Tax=Halomicrococcus sp. NG-SE-24 TaxID=3436928 RepID=UPI003D99933E